MYVIRLILLILLGFLIFSANSCTKKKDKKGATSTEAPTPTEPPEDTSEDSARAAPVPSTLPQPTSAPSVKITAHPLLLLHGILDGDRYRPFQLVAEHLRGLGFKVYDPQLAFSNTIAMRAVNIKAEVDRVLSSAGATKVNIIAHSTAGVDVRKVLSDATYRAKIASVTTLGTPHRGNKLCDWIAKTNNDTLISQTLKSQFLAILTALLNTQASIPDTDVFLALSEFETSTMQNTFNPANPDPATSDVYTQSWAGFSGIFSKDRIKNILIFTYGYLSAEGGSSDGLVTIDSAKWGNYRGTLDADHYDLTGRQFSEDLTTSPLNGKAFFQSMAVDLAERGF